MESKKQTKKTTTDKTDEKVIQKQLTKQYYTTKNNLLASMATSRTSSKTRKFTRLIKKARLLRARNARTGFERAQKNIALLESLRKKEGLTADAFFAIVPRGLIAAAVKAFPKEEKPLERSGIRLIGRFDHTRTTPVSKYKYAGITNVGKLRVINIDRLELLKNFMLTDYLKWLKYSNSLHERTNLNSALGNKPTGWPKGLVLREQFTRNLINNFPTRFEKFSTGSPREFNTSFSEYGLTIEFLRNRYPKLMQRVEKQTDEWMRGKYDLYKENFTRKQMDDYYKIYRILHKQFKVPNRKLFA